MKKLTQIIMTAALATCAGLAGAADSASPSAVEIKGIKNPVLKPYRIMATGFDAMDKHRALAPNAHELKFRINANTHAPAGVWEGLTLRLEGANTNMVLPIDAEHTFTLPRSTTAATDNAQLVLNRDPGQFNWAPQVRSAGVPAGFVRMGDARMECQVMVAVIKKMANFAASMTVSGFFGTTNWCSSDKFDIPTFTGKHIASATLLHGSERIKLKVENDATGFMAPIRDSRYGNDDLIEVIYATDQPAA